MYISSGTLYFKPERLQNALRKRFEYEPLKLAIIYSFDKANAGDVNIEIDRPLFTYYFTCNLTDHHTGLAPTAVKVTAFDETPPYQS